MVNVLDYCDILNIEIRIIYYPNQDGRWSASFVGCEIFEGASLLSAHGNAKTPHNAVADYLHQIRGKRIVLHAMERTMRREYDVPSELLGIPE